MDYASRLQHGPAQLLAPDGPGSYTGSVGTGDTATSTVLAVLSMFALEIVACSLSSIDVAFVTDGSAISWPTTIGGRFQVESSADLSTWAVESG